jgi:DNA (cytosine-5)-methyltransferase 1
LNKQPLILPSAAIVLRASHLVELRAFLLSKIMSKEHRFPYKWELKTAKFTKDKGKVFSCFACGGGSTMGYKLAGFDVIGCNEIDPKMMTAYVANHAPKYSFLEPIQTFKLRDDLPDELFNLDILDGSPPCSSFSMAGNREKDWGKEKKFREGQAEQVLDTLFFDFIDLAKRLQPKVVIAENVKGLLLGEAQAYVGRILQAFDDAGYYVGYRLLDASKMGVPQRRERVFFYAIRKDLYKGEFMDLFQSEPKLVLNFNETEILFSEVVDNADTEKNLSPTDYDLWINRKHGDLHLGEACLRQRGVESFFSRKLQYLDRVPNTVLSTDYCIHMDIPRYTNNHEKKLIGSYPLDYNFCDNKPEYLIGMSVPPVMTAQIATEVCEQWLSKIQ